MHRVRRVLGACALAAAIGVLALPSSAAAQGKGNGKSHKTPPGHAKKQVTTSQAIIVSRDILVAHGYQVVRVETVEHAHVIYYRRGNNGRGRGLGPVERMIIKPAGEIVVFESAPSKVLVDINLRLGL
jgi:hypothetical protein